VAFEHLIERMRQSGYEQRGLASLLSQYGTALVRVGRLDAAEKAYRESLAVARDTGNEEEVAAIQMGLSNVYSAREEFDRALESLDAAWQYYSRDESADPVQARMVKVLRIKALRNMGRVGEAAAAADSLLKEVGYPQVAHGPALLSVLIQAAEAQRAAGNFEFAEKLATDLIARLDETSVGNPKDNVEVGRAYVQRAEIRLDAGDAPGARRDLERAIPIIEQGLGETHDESREARELLKSL
jgi:tetratricopeptide (TPR) repeat protein